MTKTHLLSLLATIALVLVVLLLHLVPAVFIGMLVYLISSSIGMRLARYVPHGRAQLLAVAAITFIIAGAFVLSGMLLGHFFGNHETIMGLASKLAEVLTDIRSIVPPALLPYVPESLIDLRESMAHTLKLHGSEIGSVGKDSLHTLAHILIGIVISIMLTLHRFTDEQVCKPLTRAMRERLVLLTDSFANVIFAQAKISAINTSLTAIYLLLALPLTGTHLPYAKTLVIATFFAGLLPIVGNLISNSLIVVVSLGISFRVGMESLLFLVIIHKLEYFINARIVGNRVHAAAWELLMAMLVMESAFGVPGLLIAPIVYAYLKAELVKAKLV